MALVMLSNFGRADGGRETWAYNLIPRLLARYPTLKLRIIGLRVDGEPDNSERVAGLVPDERNRLSIDFVRAKNNRVPNAVAFWRGIRRLLGKSDYRPALVVAVGSFVELLAVLVTPAFRSSGKVVWLRSIFTQEKAHRYPRLLEPLLRRAEMAVLKRADVIVANGEDTARHYRKFGLPVTVIPNAVELDRWQMAPAQVRQPLNVAFIGRLAPVKGIENFLALSRLAREKGSSSGHIRFHVIGDGPAEPLVREAQSQNLLVYHGAVPNERMPEVLRSMQVCVALTFVSGKDSAAPGGAGVSNALLEQMAAGRVLLCWENDAFCQVLDESSAFFVRQGDNEALLGALLTIQKQPDVAEHRAGKASEIARKYDFDRHMRSFHDLAQKWLPQPRHSDH